MSAEPQWLTDARALEAWNRALDLHLEKTGVTAMRKAASEAFSTEFDAFVSVHPMPTVKRTAKGAR